MKTLNERNPTGWRERVSRRAALTLALAFLALFPFLSSRPPVASAGQDVELSGAIGHSVYGNGDPAYGYGSPFSGDPRSPNGNSVKGDIQVNGDIYGAFMRADAPASVGDNWIVADGQTMTAYDITGGYVDIGFAAHADVTAAGNRVSVANGGEARAYYAIYGGDAISLGGGAMALGNHVIADSGGAARAGNTSIFGGSAWGGVNYHALAADNLVAAKGGGALTAVGSVYGGYALSVNGDAQAYDNRVIAIGGTIEAYAVIGGVARGGVAASANNRVEISGGEISDHIFGGEATADLAGATASSNRVAISDGKITGSIAGGFAEASAAAASAASYNRVAISGGEIIGNIYGGFARSASGVADARDNRVDISGTPDLTGANLYGGYNYVGNGDVFSGNVLNLKTSALTAASLANFEFLNFYLPEGARAEDVIFEISGVASLQDANSPQTSTVAMAIHGAAAPLKPGERFILIDAGSSLDGSPAKSAVMAAQGVTLTHNFLLSVPGGAGGTQLVANLAGTEASTGSVALSEGFLAGLAFANSGADLVAGQGTLDAARAARESASPSTGIATFMTLSGGSSRYNTSKSQKL
jgi:hypothetical protein